MSCKLTILVDNTVKKGSDLTAEHGLAIFVETPDSSFLFDCGHTGIAWNNAEKLSVDFPKGCGFTKSDLVAWEVEEHECKDSLKLDDYAQLFTNFDRHYSFEHIPPKFVFQSLPLFWRKCTGQSFCRDCH